MDIKYLETEENLKNDLVSFTQIYAPKTRAELEIGTRFEYTKKFLEFIVTKAFEQANNLEEFPKIIQDLIGDRKHNLILNSSKASDIVVSGHFAELPLVLDYDEKRGILLKYNNRTLSKYLEIDSIQSNISDIRNKNTNSSKKLKIV